MKRYAKALSMLLAIIMMVGLLPLSIIAEDIHTPVRYTVLLLDTEKNFTMSIDNVVIYEVETPIEIIKKAAKNFVDQIQMAGGKNYVAVVSYSSSAKTETGFTADAEALKSSIDKIGIGGQFANINAALEQADTLLSGVTTEGAEKNIVLFTQGIDYEGEYSTEGHYSADDCNWYRTDNGIYCYQYSNVTYETAHKLHDKYSIYTIGLFQKFNEVPEEGMSLLNFAKRFSSDLQNKGFYDVEDADDLPFVFEDVAGDIINPLKVIFYHEKIDNIVSKKLDDGITTEYYQRYLYRITIVVTNNSLSEAKNVVCGFILPDEAVPFEEMISCQEKISKSLGDIPAQGSATITWDIEVEHPQNDISMTYGVATKADNTVNVIWQNVLFVPRFTQGEDNSIIFGKDQWAFSNSAWYFGSTKQGYYMTSDDYLNFTINWDYEAKEVIRTFVNIDNLKTGDDVQKWGGSCYGMSAIAILCKLNQISPSEIDLTADCLHDISKKNNDSVESFINFYHIQRILDVSRKEKESFNTLNQIKKIEVLSQRVNMVKNGGVPVLIGIQWYVLDENGERKVDENGEFKTEAHAVVGYGLEEGSWMWDGIRYDRCIKIYDPNYPDGDIHWGTHHEYLYYKDGTAQWTIPSYCSYLNATLTRATNDINAIDVKNYNVYKKNREYYMLSFNQTQLMVKNGLNTYEVNGLDATNGINVIAMAGIVDEDAHTPISFVVPDGNENCVITPVHNNIVSKYIMSTPKNLVISNITNLTQIEYDPYGNIKFVGDNSSYSLSMVFNDGYHTTPWYKTTVEGDSANEITMEQTPAGIIVTGDNLNDIKIIVTDDNGDKELVVSTDKDSMLITNNGDEPVIKIDSDNDGVYDKDITPKKESSPDTPSNSVIFPNLYNVTVTAGEGGKTNTSDKFYIAYGASRTIKIIPDDGYEVADVLVNGKSVGAVDSYSIKGACTDYDIKVSFNKIPD